MRITPSAWRRSANGSLSPVGSWPMPNRPTSVSSLSASATTSADRVARQRVAGKARLVVVLDGVGDSVAQAVVARVVAAHDALQLGELAHHVGQQVGLGELRGAGRPAPPSCVAAELRADRRARSRARARRARPACPACCDRPPWPGRRRATPASSCGPGRRRTWRRPGAGAPRARCRRSRALGVGRADVADHQELVGQLARARRAAGSTSGWPSS